jgi:hypothetical protein
MHKRKYVLIVVLALAITACKGEMSDVKSVAWFHNNPQQRTETLTECKNNPGELKEDPNCVNAAQAESASMQRGHNTRF